MLKQLKAWWRRCHHRCEHCGGRLALREASLREYVWKDIVAWHVCELCGEKVVAMCSEWDRRGGADLL